MGNTGSTTLTLGDIYNASSVSPSTPSLSRDKSPSPYTDTFNENKKNYTSRKIYKYILKDIKKLRQSDAHNRYNPHRRQHSILNNLPQNLKKYSNTIHVVNEFWLNHIKCLNDDTLNEMAMLLYCHLYCQCTPNARKILLKANKMNVPSHILKVFTIFEYTIRQITDTNTENHEKLFKQLKILGSVHSKYVTNSEHVQYNVRNNDSNINNIYDLLLDSFNYVMKQTFNNVYTLRIRFCFSQLYRVIIDIMNNNDLISLVHNRSKTLTMNTKNNINGSFLKQMDRFLSSLEDCLADEIGSLYFKQYLQEQFCAENYLFHEAVQKYKLTTNNKRIKLGEYIINTFIKKHSEMEINIKGSTRNKILTVINLAKKINDNKPKYQNMLSLSNVRSETASKLLEVTQNNIDDMIYSVGFTINLFDIAYEEIFYLMKANSWMSFRNTILEYCNNNNFMKQQQIKVLKKKHEENEKRKLIKNVNNLARKNKLKIKTNENKFMKKNIKIIIATPSSIENNYINDMNNLNNDVIDYGDTDSEYEETINYDDEKQKRILTIKTPVLNNSITSLNSINNDNIESNDSYSATLSLPTLEFSQTSLKYDDDKLGSDKYNQHKI